MRERQGDDEEAVCVSATRPGRQLMMDLDMDMEACDCDCCNVWQKQSQSTTIAMVMLTGDSYEIACRGIDRKGHMTTPQTAAMYAHVPRSSNCRVVDAFFSSHHIQSWDQQQQHCVPCRAVPCHAVSVPDAFPSCFSFRNTHTHSLVILYFTLFYFLYTQKQSPTTETDQSVTRTTLRTPTARRSTVASPRATRSRYA